MNMFCICCRSVEVQLYVKRDAMVNCCLCAHDQREVGVRRVSCTWKTFALLPRRTGVHEIVFSGTINRSDVR